MREAVEALRLMDEALERKSSDGWALFHNKEAVDCYLNVRPDGPTWGMGVGLISAPVAKAMEVESDPAKRNIVDKMWMSSTTLGTLPSSLLQIPEWEVESLVYGQHLYKSPAWPVGPREAATLKLIVRSPSSGETRVIQRSIDVPGCETPTGYVRLKLDCGGFSLLPTSEDACKMTYVNILDPGGLVPKSIVKRTVPERCLTVARLRNLSERP